MCANTHTDAYTHIHKNKSFLKKIVECSAFLHNVRCSLRRAPDSFPLAGLVSTSLPLFLGLWLRGIRVMWAQEISYHGIRVDDMNVLPLWLVSTTNLKASRIFWKTSLWACLMFIGVERCAHYGGHHPILMKRKWTALYSSPSGLHCRCDVTDRLGFPTLTQELKYTLSPFSCFARGFLCNNRKESFRQRLPERSGS